MNSNSFPSFPYTTKVDGKYTFLGAYQAYKEECAEFGRKWYSETQIKYESIVENKLVPNLPHHNRTPIQSYTLEDFLSTIQFIAKKGQHGDVTNFVPYEESTLQQYRHVMKTVVTVAANNENFHNVFDEEIKLKEKVKHIKKLQKLHITPKSFSVKEELLVINHLLDHLEVRGEYICLFLMYCLGLRNEEAAALNFGHVFEFEQYPGHYYITVPQSTVIHRNQTKLEVKTYNGYRNIPLPALAARVILALQEKRLQAVDKLQDWKVPIKNMWIGYGGKNPFIRCGSDHITRQAKIMFEELGMRETVDKVANYLKQDFELAKGEQVDVDEFALIEKEPTAYLLRRNFATHMAILRLSEAELPYVLGHVIEDPQIKRSDYTDERELFLIAQKMAKRPLLNDISMAPR